MDQCGEHESRTKQQRVQNAQQDQKELESIFTKVEENIISFVKDELKKDQRILSPDDSAGWRSKRKHGEDEEERSSRESFLKIRESFLKITTHFLKRMKEEELAKRLWSRIHVKLKSSLKEKFQCVFEGIAKAGNPIFPISQEDLFKSSLGRDKPIRTVLTKGVAGIGKTVLTQKYTLDWAEDKANQDIQFLFPFTFRELNVLKEEKFSLVELVHRFFTETKEEGISSFEDFKVVFIFDGLDECRLPLDFKKPTILTDPRKSTSVDVLLTNIIKGILLPSARLWITTRPVAANQIPPDCVDMVTEVRGFTDPQKEEYFRKRFQEKEKANRIISHIRTSRSLYIMCHIPVFCWITATVMEDVLKTGGQLPKTLTEMYIHFLVVQAKGQKVSYGGGAETDSQWSPESKEMIKSLGKLAFYQLQKGNLIFYESDLTECDIDIRAASQYADVFTQIFKEESGLFYFIHLSIQEFLAALHVHLTFRNDGVNQLEQQMPSKKTKVFKNKPSLNLLHQIAIDKALQSPNGHLDLFLRFLLGLSLHTNQTTLIDLQKTVGSESDQKTAKYIKKKINDNEATERKINLFHCLNELNDRSLVEKVQQYLSLGSFSTEKHSPANWSALVFILLSSDDLDIFDLEKYSASEEALLRLLPVVKASKKALLSGCNLSGGSWKDLSSVLQCESCSLKELDLSNNDLQDSGMLQLSVGLKKAHCKLEILRMAACNLSWRSSEALSTFLCSESCSLGELDLSNNDLQDSGMQQLSVGLKSTHCKLEILRMAVCNLSWRSSEILSTVLCSESCSLRELDLSNNDMQDSGMQQLSVGLKSTHCKLEILRMALCNLSWRSSEALSTVLCSESCSLRELDLSNNDLQDSGMQQLSVGLKSAHCKLESLILSGCLIRYEGFASLATALRSNPSHLRKLDLSYNHPGEPGKGLLSAGLKNPLWRLEILKVNNCGEQRFKTGLRKYACELTLDSNTAHRKLKLSENNRKVTLTGEKVQKYPKKTERFDRREQLLCSDLLTDRCYWEVEWNGEVDIAITYRGIKRKGYGDDCRFGMNNQSWCLRCSDGGFFVCHNNKMTSVPSSSVSNRVAVYVDRPAGTLSFYSVSSDKLIRMHTFNTTFTKAKALYAGFGFVFGLGVESLMLSINSSVTLCSI